MEKIILESVTGYVKHLCYGFPRECFEALENGIPALQEGQMDITNPASAYLFLSDDVQDEIRWKDHKRIRIQSCGDRFAGDLMKVAQNAIMFFAEEVFSNVKIYLDRFFYTHR